MVGAVSSVAGCERDGVDAARRADRYLAREVLWRRSRIDRLRQCGRFMLSSEVGLRLSTGDDGARVAGWANLEHCGSVWSCPVCSAKVNHRRSLTLAEALRRWDRRGGRVLMVTLTVRHDRSQSLADVWRAVAKGWKAAGTGSSWSKAEAVYGGVQRPNGKPWIPWWRVFEVTHGRNGWHVHVHALLFVGDGFSEADGVAIANGMWDRWDRAVRGAGMAGGDRVHGVDARLVTGEAAGERMGRYFSKAVFELTGSRFKTGAVRGNHRTPWGILEDLVRRDGRTKAAKRDMSLWWEWEEASRGKRQMGRSRGLLELLGMEEWEPTDQEIVDETMGGVDVTLVDAGTWRAICRTSGAAASILTAAERSVSDALAMIRLLSGCGRPPTAPVPLVRVLDVPSLPRGPARTPAEVRSLYGVELSQGTLV